MTQRRKTHRRILHRLALASLAALCIGAPVASAAPIDPPGTGATTTQDPRQQDMHASTVQKPGKVVVVRDARGESAAGGGTTGGTATKAPLPGPPTWPENPTPLPQPEQQPVATGDSDDIGIDLPVALLILAGTLALGGGLAVAGMKARAHTTRTAH